MNASEGGAELCRVHIASGLWPHIQEEKKDFPEEGIQCQLGAEVQSEPGGARSPYWKEGLWGEILPYSKVS